MGGAENFNRKSETARGGEASKMSEGAAGGRAEAEARRAVCQETMLFVYSKGSIKKIFEEYLPFLLALLKRSRTFSP